MADENLWLKQVSVRSWHCEGGAERCDLRDLKLSRSSMPRTVPSHA